MGAQKEKVVIIGNGWGGYRLGYEIDHYKYDVTAISPENTSAVTPLLVSAACGLFDPRLAHDPTKGFPCKVNQGFRHRHRFNARTLIYQPAFDKLESDRFIVDYNKIILVPGCRSNTFDIPGVAENAIFVKKVANANAVRSRLNDIPEMASLPRTSEDRQRQLLHVAIIGGGPTGIEMAAELTVLIDGDVGVLFPHLKGKASVSVYDVAPQILALFDQKLAEYATSTLGTGRVNIKVNTHILKSHPVYH
ncbi:hypothetical protein V8C42DRAFT_358051 [Trichoderma barbatum]